MRGVELFSATPVSIREATADDAPAIIALFQQVFGKARALPDWRWMFVDAPRGPGQVVVAELGGRLVGHAAVVTRAFQINGRRTLIGQSVDAMTAPDHQRKGINRALSKALFEACLQGGVEVVYGFSNRNSTPTVLRDQGREPIGPFPVLVRPLRLVRAPFRLARRRDRTPPPMAASLPTDVQRLWETVAPFADVSVVRDAPYLGWRYSRPSGVYRAVEVRTAGHLTGLGVLGLRTQMGLRTAFVTEAMAAGDDPRTWRDLLAALLDAARELDCDAVSALAFPGVPERRAYVRAGFVPVPARLNPEDIVFSVRRSDGAREPALITASRWRLAWGEHDLL